MRNTGEGNLAGWRLWLDADRDGALDSGEKTATTDTYGNYRFSGLAAGSYRLRQIVNAGWRRTYPSGAWYDVTLTSGGTSAKNFGNTQKILISGRVFSDANADRIKSSTEAGLGNWRIFIDTDLDGV